MAARRVPRTILSACRPVAALCQSQATAAPSACSSRLLHLTTARPLPRTTTRPVTVESAAAWSLGPRRFYSAQSDSKIWEFKDIQKLSQEADPKVVIVDVREPGELKSTGHIPRAVNIPVSTAPDSFHISDEEFEDRFGYRRPDKDAEVVFYCKAGVRSRAAAGLAREAGWTRAGEYPGSWIDWEKKGGEVQKSDE